MTLKVERKNTVVNLSSRELTEVETEVLSKGLNFFPTPGEPVLASIHTDLEKFHNNLRWKQHFSEQLHTIFSNLEKNISCSKVFRKESSHKPPMGSQYLETFATLNEIELAGSKVHNPKKQNLSVKEKSAIKTLYKDKFITIKPADKGGAVVVLNTTDYVKEPNKQLSNPNFSEKVPEDLTETHTRKVNTYIDGLIEAGQLNNKLRSRLLTTDTKTPSFYLLPKLDKPKRPPKGRPIISANGCATEKISARHPDQPPGPSLGKKVFPVRRVTPKKASREVGIFFFFFLFSIFH